MSNISNAAKEGETEGAILDKKKEKETKKFGRVNISELVTELRHKYLTILKSQYWEFFEEGQCMPESVVVLMESADRAMDHEEHPMEDWSFIKTYIISDTFLKILSGLS